MNTANFTSNYHQQDAHVANWLKATFNLTVEYMGNDVSGPCFTCWSGEYDLDTPQTSGSTVFWAATEYAACFNGALSDRLTEIEMGEPLAIRQFCELVGV